MGRLTLVKSNLNVIPVYTMQYFTLPASMCNIIDKIQRDFLWGSTINRKRMHYVFWDTCTLLKANVGLGLSKARTKNCILLTASHGDYLLILVLFMHMRC